MRFKRHERKEDIARLYFQAAERDGLRPYPVWLWLNGHEWAKRQAEQQGVEVRRARQRLSRV